MGFESLTGSQRLFSPQLTCLQIDDLQYLVVRSVLACLSGTCISDWRHVKLHRIPILVSFFETESDIHVVYDNHANGYITNPVRAGGVSQDRRNDSAFLRCRRQTIEGDSLDSGLLPVSVFQLSECTVQAILEIVQDGAAGIEARNHRAVGMWSAGCAGLVSSEVGARTEPVSEQPFRPARAMIGIVRIAPI